MSTHKKSLYLCLTTVLVLCHCTDKSSPFTPDDLTLTELVYFPLWEGYKADYAYHYYHYFATSWEDEIETTYRKDGVFHLEVANIRVKKAEKEVFYKIRTTFSIEKAYHYTIPGDTVWEGVSDSLASTEYDVMLKNGSLWYINNAPSFENLDQGDTTLMMASPIACGGEINLKMFPVTCSGNLNLFHIYGDTCAYDLYTSNYAATVKNKGLLNMHYHYEYRGAHIYEIRDEIIELIE